jgi:hypothetical protein
VSPQSTQNQTLVKYQCALVAMVALRQPHVISSLRRLMEKPNLNPTPRITTKRCDMRNVLRQRDLNREAHHANLGIIGKLVRQLFHQFAAFKAQLRHIHYSLASKIAR